MKTSKHNNYITCLLGMNLVMQLTTLYWYSSAPSPILKFDSYSLRKMCSYYKANKQTNKKQVCLMFDFHCTFPAAKMLNLNFIFYFFLNWWKHPETFTRKWRTIIVSWLRLLKKVSVTLMTAMAIGQSMANWLYLFWKKNVKSLKNNETNIKWLRLK